MLKDQGWISVEDKLPEEGIRVWASSGNLDCGNDCYIGYKPCLFIEMTGDPIKDYGEVRWRYSCDSLEIPINRKITHWMPLPNPPGYVEFKL